MHNKLDLLVLHSYNFLLEAFDGCIVAVEKDVILKGLRIFGIIKLEFSFHMTDLENVTQRLATRGILSTMTLWSVFSVQLRHGPLEPTATIKPSNAHI